MTEDDNDVLPKKNNNQNKNETRHKLAQILQMLVFNTNQSIKKIFAVSLYA